MSQFNITRRKFLVTSSLSGVGLTVGSRGFPQSRKKVRFGIATDSHYARREPVGNRFYQEGISKLEEFVAEMNREKVDFVIHLGDFKDEDQNKRTEDTLVYLEEIEAVFSQFQGPKFHCVGNHDVDSITKDQFLNKIENTGIPKDKSYFSFDSTGFHFIILDANFHADGKDHFFKEGADWQDTNVCKDQLSWLEKDLKATRLDTVVFCHHALHEYILNGKKFHVNNYQQIQRILESSNKVKAVFQGHVHKENFEAINGIHYITQLAMVDFEGLENNTFALVEIDESSIVVNGYKRCGSRVLN